MIRQDLHIHTHLSSCSGDPEQTPQNIHANAVSRGIDQICFTDHFWDSSMPGASAWYESQNLKHIRASLSELPPDSGETEIYFGCETEYTGGERIGISYQTAMELDFVLIPISHFHMRGYVAPASITTANELADLWCRRYRELLQLDLPWNRIGLAHPLDCCVGDLQNEFMKYLLEMPLSELFGKTAELGISLEINGSCLFDGEAARINREIYTLMKSNGCTFTTGSDAHRLERLETIEAAIDFAETIGLDSSDFRILRKSAGS